MTGRELVVVLERHGFIVRRRSRSYVWVARGEQTLMLDEEASVPEAYLARILDPGSASAPSSRRSHPPSSVRRAVRASVRPSGRPSKRH